MGVAAAHVDATIRPSAGRLSTRRNAPMLVNEMEQLLKNIDARLTRVEQVLPTLATKADLERLATKADLAQVSAKVDLAQVSAKVDHLEGSVETLAEHVKDLGSRIDGTNHRLQMMATVLERLDRRR
jgi:DNA integrity scanning protein DisA with diadenylate cyclase activity